MNKKYPVPAFSKFFLLLLFLIPFSGNAQEKVTLSGYIKDAGSGETLIGANVFVRETSNGAMTNEYGFYSVSLPAGDYNVEFSYLGYETKKELISLTEKKTMNVELAEEGIMFTEVVVTSEAEDENITTTEMSTNELKIKTITKMPALLGEADVIRSIQLLPGVSTVGEGATGFNVRGGGVDQNLVLLDEAPVYNSSHLFGFFSVFNPDAVKDVKLYKGGIPSRYGGRLSSILDVRMKEGNSKKLAVSGGVGFIFSRLAIEAPIIKDKMSFIVAGRRSYIDVLAKPFLDGGLEDTALNFYDLTFKTNYKISDKDRIFLSGYLGRDNFGFGDDAGFSWGNSTATLRWNHLFSDKLFANFTAYYSNYDYQINFGSDDQDSFDWDAGIVNYSAKSDLSWFLNPDNLITFGGQAILYDFSPGNAIGVSDGETRDFSVEEKWALEGGLFAENEQKINSRISLQYGLRLSYFNYMGEGTAYQFEDTEPGLRKRELVDQRERFDQWESIQDYINLEPRASIKFQVDKTSSLKASYNRMHQYIHLVSNSTASTPLDVWTPSTNNLKPQQVDQYALGYFKNWKDNNYTSSVEVYYKDFDNLLDFVNGADLFVNPLLEGELLAGRGRAYGMELQVEKTKGKFTGWFSYTLARTERKVDGVNNNEWFASRFDQTHNFSTTAFYELNKRWTFSANFLFTTGTPATFPTDRIEQQGYVIPNIASGSRNNVRIPAYHRMDISATLNGKEKAGKRWNGNWVFSIYNVYNRRNPFTIFFRQPDARTGAGEPISTEAIQFSVIGNFIPSVAYNFEF
ncbi:MAG: carboxypeptidase-like regulatory domain-containing protein [Saprospiraceae bacterium]